MWKRAGRYGWVIAFGAAMMAIGGVLGTTARSQVTTTILKPAKSQRFPYRPGHRFVITIESNNNFTDITRVRYHDNGGSVQETDPTWTILKKIIYKRNGHKTRAWLVLDPGARFLRAGGTG